MTKQQQKEYDLTYSQFLESRYFRVLHYEEYSNKKKGAHALLKQLHRYETTLHRIAENACNGWSLGNGFENTEWRAKDERKEASIKEKVNAIADDLGFKVRFNSDPRGYAICFVLPSGKSNSWDVETWRLNW